MGMNGCLVRERYLEGRLKVFTGHSVATRVGLLGGCLAVGSWATLNLEQTSIIRKGPPTNWHLMRIELAEQVRANLVGDLQSIPCRLHQIRARKRP
jgi:hypothetical protein